MATISFINLDQTFDIGVNDSIAFSASDFTSSTNYSYLTTGGDDWEIYGSGLTYAAGLPTGGTVTGVELDLDNDGGAIVQEIIVTGLSLSATSLGIGSGTADQQRDAFWSAVLAGDDTFNFTLADFTVGLTLGGDGATVTDGQLHLAGDDVFIDGGAMLSGFSILSGDFETISSGVVVGGNDTYTVGALSLYADATAITGGTLIGGDDVITPARLANTTSGDFFAAGDVTFLDGGSVFGGNDRIDLRSTDLTGFTQSTHLFGDVFSIDATGALIAGNDTIHGSAATDLIYGDYVINSGYVEGGKDRLFGYAGNDTIFGNEGRDQLFGGDNDDLLNGGLDGDIIDGGIGNDLMTGDTGNDSMLGGDGNDTLVAGSGSDTVDGGVGDDAADAGAGTDVMIGGTGKDSLFGGTGTDSITGDAGNDTLQGGDQNDTILGGAGFDVLLGGNDNDFLDGGASNDILFGNAGVDTFNFAFGGGTDTVRDMVAGVGLNDVIRLEGFGAAFNTFAEVMAAATDNGTDTTINFGGGNILIVQNVTVAQFNTDDFIFG